MNPGSHQQTVETIEVWRELARGCLEGREVYQKKKPYSILLQDSTLHSLVMKLKPTLDLTAFYRKMLRGIIYLRQKCRESSLADSSLGLFKCH